MANVRKTIKLAKSINSADALTTLKEAIAYYKTRQVEQTKREEIWSKRDVLILALNNEKDVLLSYFEYRFSERRDSLEQFYNLLHKSVDSGNEIQLQTALTGILGIIQENPLSDFAEFRKNMANPNFTLEL